MSREEDDPDHPEESNGENPEEALTVGSRRNPGKTAVEGEPRDDLTCAGRG